MLKLISNKKKINENYNIKYRSSAIFPIYINQNIKNKKIKDFLKDDYGWVYAQLNNIYLDGWYFAALNESVGGDHAF